MLDLKKTLDELVIKYDTPDFIQSDPVQFIHKYRNKQDIEIIGLIASSLAYGKREAFIEKLHYINKIFENNPYKFCLNLNKTICHLYFKDFKYRFNTGADICILLDTLHRFYNENNCLDDFVGNNIIEQGQKAKNAVTIISDELTKNVDLKSYCYLFPNPRANSACKRLNLFLKWMVRKSSVDVGIWESLKPCDLIIPLDVHVAKVARELKLTNRKANDWQTAEEITSKLRTFDRNDPVKYDFALFDIGIEKLAVNL